MKGKRLYELLAGLDAPVKISSPAQLVSWYDVERGAKTSKVEEWLRKELKEWNVGNLDFEVVTVSSSRIRHITIGTMHARAAYYTTRTIRGRI